MRTIEEAARDYAELKDKANAEWVMEDFTAGVEFAQRWISVEEELPEIKDKAYQILITHNDGLIGIFWVRKKGFCTDTDNADFFKRHSVTHWRRIDLK